MLGERVLRIEALAKMTFWVEGFEKMTLFKGFPFPDFQGPSYLAFLNSPALSLASCAPLGVRGGQRGTARGSRQRRLLDEGILGLNRHAREREEPGADHLGEKVPVYSGDRLVAGM